MCHCRNISYFSMKFMRINNSVVCVNALDTWSSKFHVLGGLTDRIVRPNVTCFETKTVVFFRGARKIR